ncbi:MAG: 4Fe-4S dicluster domain-containing protein [Deltaproteobacteria bacterium]|nr:4Fe-4S dicluster domain-containing protein [Deltaproteobacteria bacterium]
MTYLFFSFGRFCAPFHMAAIKKPGYAISRYLFHICLVVVPIWLAGHIALWEESRFEWGWISLPDAWADGMTLVLLALAAFFLLRRIFHPEIRKHSSGSDSLLITVTALPFLSGFLYAHGSLDAIPLLGDYMGTIHVISGEVMMVSVVFLFCRTRLDRLRCTGCAACELICPTGTLRSDDEGGRRIFSYRHYQCLCCGGCVETCPEDAAELIHNLSFNQFFRIMSAESIRTVELQVCELCESMYAPGPLLQKVEGMVPKISEDYIRFCPDCRGSIYADKVKDAAC